MRCFILVATLCVGMAIGQQYPTTTPVPILKQINRHNEDGSYSYGFEAADGSYKIESKHPTGEVFGKYGFVDDTGNLREIEYGASSKQGFVPAGSGINVPPPPPVNSNSIAGEKDDPDDDGQYREDPSIYYTDPRYTNGERYDPVPKRYNPIQNHQVYQRPYNSPSKSVAAAYRPAYQPAAPAPAPAPVPVPAPAPIQPQYPQYQAQYASYPQYQPQYSQPEYQPQYRTQYQRNYPQPSGAYSQVQYNYASNRYPGQPAHNVDYARGSYSVNYKR